MQIMSEEQAETKPKVENANVINLVVKDQDGEVHFKVCLTMDWPCPLNAELPTKSIRRYFLLILQGLETLIICWCFRAQVKPHTAMQRIMDAYAQKKGVEAKEIRFLFDGTRVRPEMTPQGLDMEVGPVQRAPALIINMRLIPGRGSLIHFLAFAGRRCDRRCSGASLTLHSLVRHLLDLVEHGGR